MLPENETSDASTSCGTQVQLPLYQLQFAPSKAELQRLNLLDQNKKKVIKVQNKFLYI